MKYGGLDPKIISNTCEPEENGTAKCIEGKRYDIIFGEPLGIGKEKFIIYLLIFKL